MKIDIFAFSVDPDRLGLDETTDLVVHVPRGLPGKASLLSALGKGLKFPAYFGGNWDALSDLLRDLSWLPQRRIAILHSDLPRLPTAELIAYLNVLEDCARDWKEGEGHELVIAFPLDAYTTIENLLGRTRIRA